MVADAGPGAGLGHLSRSTALASALRTRGVAVRALAYGAGHALVRDDVAWSPAQTPEVRRLDTLVVVDSYELPRTGLDELARGPGLVTFHDAGQPAAPPEARLVLDVTGEAGPRMLAGPRYACLGRAYWGVEPDPPAQRVARVLVATGGGVVAGGAAMARALRQALPDVEIRLVAAAANADLPQDVTLVAAPAGLSRELLGADLVLCAAGQTLLEALACGRPCVAVALADNQRGQLQLFADAGAVLPATTPEQGAALAAQLASNADERSSLSQRARSLVDGCGALRVAARVAALC